MQAQQIPVAGQPVRGRGRPVIYPDSKRFSVQIPAAMQERLWNLIRREPISPIVLEALVYYLDALEAGRVQRPGK